MNNETVKENYELEEIDYFKILLIGFIAWVILGSIGTKYIKYRSNILYKMNNFVWKNIRNYQSKYKEFLICPNNPFSEKSNGINNCTLLSITKIKDKEPKIIYGAINYIVINNKTNQGLATFLGKPRYIYGIKNKKLKLIAKNNSY